MVVGCSAVDDEAEIFVVSSEIASGNGVDVS